MVERHPQRILILGGGFGGVSTAQELSRLCKGDDSVEITLVNRDNHFVFVPMLPEAAAGTIEAMNVVVPLRQLIPDVRFRAEEVTGVDITRKLVTTRSLATGRERELGYEHLVLALGTVIDLARLPGVAQHGMSLKTLGDAIAIRNHVLHMLEAAAIEGDPAVRAEMLTFVVAGGGFSGVEMVGELNDQIKEALPLYRSLEKKDIRVILLHSRDRILPEMPDGAAQYALRMLRARGVEVRLNERLASATPRDIVLQSGRRIATRTLIVALGNAPPPLLSGLPLPKERGRIVVDATLQVPGYPGVWALGDNAVVPNQAATGDEPSPPTAQYALRQGKLLARNIAAAIQGGQARPFAYGGLGLLCLFGHGVGVGTLPFGIQVSGFPAFFLWRWVYWSKLPSLGRKIKVGIDWALEMFLRRDMAQLNLSRTQALLQAHYEAGETIFQQGERGDYFYMIQAGEVEVVRESGEEAVVLARLGQGDYFGETALLDDRPRNASVRTLTPVDLTMLGRDDFSTLNASWSDLRQHLRTISQHRSQATREALAEPDAAALLRDEEGRGFSLDRLVCIGSGPENDIVVDEAEVARRQALIQRTAQGYRIESLAGESCIRVDGHPLREPAALADGASVQIGSARFTFHHPPVAGDHAH